MQAIQKPKPEQRLELFDLPVLYNHLRTILIQGIQGEGSIFLVYHALGRMEDKQPLRTYLAQRWNMHQKRDMELRDYKAIIGENYVKDAQKTIERIIHEYRVS